MKSSLKKQAERFLREQKNYKRWLAVFVCLAVVVTIGTTAALKYKGIAVTSDDSATEAMHMEQTEGNTDEIPEGMRRHVHTEACYEEQLVLVCGAVKAEAEAGETADAGAADTETSDAGAADSGASDTGAAPEESEPADASQGHTHSDDCYEVTGGTEKLTCTKEEHTHGDGCYETKTVTETVTKTVPETVTEEVTDEEGNVTTVEKTVDKTVEETVEKEEKVLTCTKEEHTHGASCYTAEGGERTLVCGKEEGEGAEAPAAVNADAAAPAASTAAETAAPASTDAVSEETKAPAAAAAGAEKADAAPAGNPETAEEAAGEHVHTDACYELQKVLICGKEEGELEEIPVEGFAAGTLVAEGEDYEIIVSYGPEAEIPEGARLEAEEIPEDSDTYKEYYDKALDAMAEAEAEEKEQEEQEITFARLFDITIFSKDGEEIEPAKPVEVQIIYDDAVVGEEDNGVAVHFQENGDTEVIDAEVTDGKEFRHTQSGFSPLFHMAKARPSNVITGYSDGVVITAKSNVDFEKGTVLHVEEFANGREEHGKALEHSKKAIKDRLQQQEDPEVSSERVFSVYFEKDNEQIAPEGDIEITVQYTKGVKKAEKSGSKVMVLDDGKDSGTVLSSEAVQEGEEVAVFFGTQNFSAAAPNVMTTMLAGVTLADIEIKSDAVHDDIGDYLKSELQANEWQVVAERYGDATITTNVGDKVRVQKNIIPTGTENEFYVHLSIDMQEVVSEFLNISTYYKAPSPSQGDKDGAITTTKPNGDDKGIWTVEKGEFDNTNGNVFRLRREADNSLIGEVYVKWESSEHCTVYLKLDDGHYLLLKTGAFSADHKQGANGYDIKIDKETEEAIKGYAAEKAMLQVVTDDMGDNITYVDSFEGPSGESFAGDYFPSTVTSTGTYTTGISEDGRTLTWCPAIDQGVFDENSTATAWYEDVAQLVYKVRLDVKKENFQSCAEHRNEDGAYCKNCDKDHAYEVNKGATLSYVSGKDKSGNDIVKDITFPKPYVRGLLYDIELKKVDDSTPEKPLEGAVFTLVDSENGKQPTKVETITATSGEDGIVRFKDLPWGTYTITETKAPDKYKISEDLPIDVTVCYTDSPANLKQDDAPKEANMIYVSSESDGKIKVVNKKNPSITVRKIWDDEENNEHRPKSVKFKIEYFSNGNPSTVPGQTDKDGKIIVDDEGCVTLEGDAKTDIWEMVVENLPETEGNYRITEVMPENSDLDKYYEIVTVDGKEETIYSTTDGVTGSAIVKEEGKIPCYMITNTLKKKVVNLTKVDADTIKEATPLYLKDAQFKLYKKTTGDYSNDEPENVSVITVTDSGVITATDYKLALGEYWLIEVKAPGGYEDATSEKPIVFILKVEEEGVTLCDASGNPVEGSKVEGNNEVRVPNTPKKVKLLKKETGSVSKYLKDAEFTVEYTPKDGEGGDTYYWKSGDEGVIGEVKGDEIVPITKLPLGTYTLRETKAPDGYNMLENTITMTVGENEITLTGIGIDANKKTISYEKDSTGETCYLIEIANSAGIELPETGGPGTVAYTFGGLAMMIAVSLMYGLNMRRKREKGGLM